MKTSIKPIKVYYSLATIHSWKEILTNQLEKVFTSSLLEHISEWNMGINLYQSEVDIPTIDGLNLKILYVTQENPYETWVYRRMMTDAKESTEPYNVLYLHSKGVNGNPFAKSWRDYMEYFCIEKWKDCVAGLGTEYDTCGVNLRHPVHETTENAHYSGNFWWATSDYIKTLDDSVLQARIRKYGRLAEEQFTCSNTTAIHKSWHDTYVNFYHEAYPEENYRL